MVYAHSHHQLHGYFLCAYYISDREASLDTIYTQLTVPRQERVAQKIETVITYAIRRSERGTY